MQLIAPSAVLSEATQKRFLNLIYFPYSDPPSGETFFVKLLSDGRMTNFGTELFAVRLRIKLRRIFTSLQNLVAPHIYDIVGRKY